MNGWMYDPVVGRMLSTDNIIGAYLTQGYDRYSYALNNPLKYTGSRWGEMIIKYGIIK